MRSIRGGRGTSPAESVAGFKDGGKLGRRLLPVHGLLRLEPPQLKRLLLPQLPVVTTKATSWCEPPPTVGTRWGRAYCSTSSSGGASLKSVTQNGRQKGVRWVHRGRVRKRNQFCLEIFFKHKFLWVYISSNLHRLL